MNNSLTDLLPLLASIGGNPQYRDSVMHGFLTTRQQFEREAMAKQQADALNQLRQAEVSNFQADNARADQALQLQQQNAQLNHLLHFREAAGQQAQTIAQTATDPLAAQNELAAQSIGLRKDFGVPMTTSMPTPDMAGMISQRKKKRAADLYAEAEKRYGPEAMAGDSITLQSPEFGAVKPSALRQMFETPAVTTQGTPAVPFVKPTPTKSLQSKEMLVGGKPSVVNFNPETGQYTDLKGAGLSDVAPIPPKPNAGDEPLSPEDIHGAAQAILSGRMAPSQLSIVGGMGNRGVKFKQGVVAEVNAQNPTFNWQQAEAGFQYGKAPGTQTTVRYLDNVAKTIPMLRAANNEFKRTGVRFVNQALKTGGSQLGSVNVADFEFKQTLLADEIAKVLQGGGTGSGTSDAKLQQASKILAGDYTPEQFSKVLDAAEEMMKVRRQSLTSGTFMDTGAPPPTEPTKRIRVKRKSDGQTGTILDSDFDPAKYDKVP